MRPDLLSRHTRQPVSDEKIEPVDDREDIAI